jgi:hypothetical protein
VAVSRHRLLVAGAAILVARAALAAEDKLPRRELAPLEQALAEAVSRVSHPAAVPMLGIVDTCRGYRLPGFGAFFVLAPRFVPTRIAIRRTSESDLSKAAREVSRAIAGMEEKQRAATTDAEKQALTEDIANMKERLQNLHQREQAQQALEREIQAYEAQVQQMHNDAIRAQEEAEHAMRQMMQRLGTTGGTVPAETPPAPRAAPPWLSWGETSADDSRSPEQILSDVRQAIMDVLQHQGAAVETLGPDEVVAVAVDFVRNPAVDGPQPPGRTLVVRAPKRVLDTLRDGKLSLEEGRKQFQVAEY